MSVNLTYNSMASMLEGQLMCPIDLEPLTQAVSLVPCAHKIQETAAKKLFGPVEDGWKVNSKNSCPVCRIPTLGYMVDHLTRNIVNEFVALPQKDLHHILKTMKETLVEKSKSVEKEAKAAIPYPGKPARFIHQNGTWDLYDSGGSLCRRMNFISSTKDSLIERFSLFGYKNGNVLIFIKFLENIYSAKDYFKNFDIILTETDLSSEYISKNPDELRVIFNILAENNEIPASHFDQIRDIIAKGTC